MSNATTNVSQTNWGTVALAGVGLYVAWQVVNAIKQSRDPGNPAKDPATSAGGDCAWWNPACSNDKDLGTPTYHPSFQRVYANKRTLNLYYNNTRWFSSDGWFAKCVKNCTVGDMADGTFLELKASQTMYNNAKLRPYYDAASGYVYVPSYSKPGWIRWQGSPYEKQGWKRPTQTGEFIKA